MLPTQRVTIAIAALTVVHFSTATANEITLQAFRGLPFCVGVLRIPYSDETQTAFRALDADLPDDVLLQLGDEAFYPVAERSGIGRSRTDSGTTWSVYFLYKPADRVAVNNPFGGNLTVDTVDDVAKYDETLKRWWQLYTAGAQRSAASDQYSPEIDQYLLTMLAGRLGESVPTLHGRYYLSSDYLSQTISFLAGTESIRLAMQKETLLQTNRETIKAVHPLPKAVVPPAVEIPAINGEVPIEPIAAVVPHECLYVRFGSFENFTWFRDRVEEWGSDLRDMASARALDYQISRRLNHQLQLQDTELARLLGPTVIKDVAIIGTDTFVREGAGLGILFHASSNAVLAANLQVQRNAGLASHKEATLKPVEFRGTGITGTLLSTPDNRIRSFYVTHGDFHLITSSRYVAQRFLEAAEKKQDVLGETDEFRLARALTPLSRNDSAFIYLSDAFFRRMVSPEFRVEMTRRARSENEIQLVEFARLAAKAEGHKAESLSDLTKGGFLPDGFGIRPDGSTLQMQNHEYVDSVRGARGSFIPVCDVQVTGVTMKEVQAYRTFTANYRALWRMMDPATVAISRKLIGNREHLTMDLHVYPFPVREYQLLTTFSQGSSEQAMQLPKQAVWLLEGNVLGGTPSFVGMLDQPMPFTVTNDGDVRVTWDNAFTANAFVGSWGNGGLWYLFGKDKFKEGEFVTEQSKGSRNSINRVTYRNEGVSVAANRQETIEAILGDLNTKPSQRSAQYRLHVGDLRKSEAAKLLHARTWSQARVMSRGNAALLNRLTSQLHVPPENAKATAESILGGSLVCPFGGRYELMPMPQRLLNSAADKKETGHNKLWVSSKAPRWQDYRFRLLDRARQAVFEITLENTTLTTHVELQLDRSDSEPDTVTVR